MSNQLTWLDQIDVASPCHVAWGEMDGDDRARDCRQCRQSVYNLSEMSRPDAEAFVRQHAGQACIRFYRRADGTILTRDCPVGLRAIKQRLFRSVAALAGIVAALVTGTLFGSKLKGVQPEGYQPPSQALAEWIEPGSTEIRSVTMGFCVLPNTPSK